MPTYPEMRNSLGRHRRKQFSVLPTTPAAFDVPNNLKTTSFGQPFRLHASPGYDILIFCTTANPRQLCQASILYTDGTFESCPVPFCQLFTIHAFDQDKLVSLIYCLMADKRRQS